MNKNKIGLLEEIIDFVENLLDDEKDITSYDKTISYDNEPKLYERCPHCDSEEYKFIKEILEDAVMKVKCNKCENNYYINFGK